VLGLARPQYARKKFGGCQLRSGAGGGQGRRGGGGTGWCRGVVVGVGQNSRVMRVVVDGIEGGGRCSVRVFFIANQSATTL
jgi:hypothetical protein